MAWIGYHYNGRDAARHEVAIDVLAEGLRLSGFEDPEPRLWCYDSIRLAPGSVTGEPVKFERAAASGLTEALLVSDRSILGATAVHARHLSPRPDRSPAVPIAITGAIVSVALIAVIYFWGLPALADRIALRVPVSWEEKLGEAVLAELAPNDRICGSPELRHLQAIGDMLTQGEESPYRIRVSVVRHPMVNAFAAPGGAVVIHSSLLEKTKRAEELAGVIAHEIEHVVQRHATRSLLRTFSAGLIFPQSRATQMSYPARLARRARWATFTSDASRRHRRTAWR